MKSSESFSIPRPARALVVSVSILLLAAISIGLAIKWKRNHVGVDAHELNLLLITLDTTRADALGVYGNGSANTPNLDRLAREGTLFRRCSSCTSITLPSHCTLMTGLYPFVHGVRRNGTTRLANEYQTLAETLTKEGLQTEGIVASFVLNRMFGLDQGFKRYSDVPRGKEMIALHAERDGQEIGAEAVQALRSLAAKRFFLWAHFYDPHFPYESSKGNAVDSPVAYTEEISYTDRQVGNLIEELRKLDIERRTLVVVVGDHGESFGEHGESQHGYFVYDATLHVPLIFRCPGTIPGGRDLSALVRTIDVAPTILELLGAAPHETTQGASLAPLLRGDAEDLDLAVYGESLEGNVQFGLSPLRSLQLDQWKYIHAPAPELYDLDADPGELNNVIDSHAEIAEEMRERLRHVIAEAPAPAPPDQTSVELAAADMARLNALGYVAGGTGATEEGAEISRFEPRGADPKDYADVFTLYAQAHWALTSRQFDLGEQLLRRLTERMPESARLLADLGFMLQQQGKAEQALEQYEMAVAVAPDDGHIQRMYGGLLIQLRRWDEAIKHLTIAVAERPDDLEAWYNLGMVVAMRGRYEEAAEYFERALRVDSLHVSTIHALGAVRLQQNRLAEAKACFRKALKINPQHQRSLHDLQAVNQRLGAEVEK